MSDINLIIQNTTPANLTLSTALCEQGPQGPQGQAGANAPVNVVSIGTVSTAASGVSASATITGTAPSQTLNLTLPRGDTGATGATGAGVEAGAVIAFAMNSAPTGWLAANGAAVSRTAYAALFAAIGTTYGTGDGSTTFTLPDLRGYFVRGSGTNADGTAAGTFGAKQSDSIRDHTHSWRYDAPGRAAGGAATNTANGSGGAIYDIGMTAGTAGPETRPKNIPMLYCIKF